MSYLQMSCPVIKMRAIAADIYDLFVHAPGMAEAAQPGQFVHVRLPGFPLRRPISICEARGESLRLVFEIRGEGTRALAKIREGETLDLLGPLGRGFSEKEPGRVVVGGGIGAPPLLYAADGDTTAILGFRSAPAVILTEDFKRKGCDVRLCTDDGSAGYHGTVIEPLRDRLRERETSLVCACGPAPMLKAVVALASEFGVKSEISLEERMGCGIGACLVCACRTVRDGKEIYSHVCKDGPVFNGEEAVLE